jgi:hypothetical protein
MLHCFYALICLWCCANLEVLTAVAMEIKIFWDVTPCVLVDLDSGDSGESLKAGSYE